MSCSTRLVFARSVAAVVFGGWLLAASAVAAPVDGSIGGILAEKNAVVIDTRNIQPIAPEALPSSLADVNKPSPLSWFDGGKPKVSAINGFLEQLAKAKEQGLIATDYGLHDVQAQWQAFPNHHNDQTRRALDDALTKAADAYINDVHYGRYRRPPLDPQLLPLYAVPDRPPLAFLEEALASPDVAASLASLEPQHPVYRALKDEYNRLGAVAETDYPVIPAGKTLVPGTYDSRASLLAERLQKEGLLSASSAMSSPGNTYYAGDLVEAVKTFQTSQGIRPDGMMGEATRYALNITPTQRRRQLLVNMERWRWMPHDLGQRYILVNIPSFTLDAVENGEKKLSMDVIVGRPERPTPAFSSVISGVIFKPAWHVPKKLAVEDKLPLIRRSPAWLTQNNFEVLQNGKRISPWNVPWSSYNKDYFPVTLRQKPGKRNALGRIRFNLENTLAIYLHDTSEPGLFSSSFRARSSGCVRVSRPQQLAYFIFEGEPAWPPQRIDTYYTSNIDTTKHVALTRDTDVHIAYFTAYPNANGHIVYYPDIYSLDTSLMQEMVGQLAKTDY
jgi:L,D-transpeptidase YcbB